MKLLPFLLVLFVFAQGAVINNPEDDLRRTRACLTESGVSYSTIKKTHSGKFDEDSSLKEYLLCVSKNAGYQNEAGYLQSDVIRMRLKSGHYSEDTIDELIQKCSQNKETPQETAFQFMKCMHENSVQKRYT